MVAAGNAFERLFGGRGGNRRDLPRLVFSKCQCTHLWDCLDHDRRFAGTFRNESHVSTEVIAVNPNRPALALILVDFQILIFASYKFIQKKQGC